jgi:hypothetical protein
MWITVNNGMFKFHSAGVQVKNFYIFNVISKKTIIYLM